jgi:hypothetical protein
MNNGLKGHAVAGAVDKLIAQYPHDSAMFGAHTTRTDSHWQEILSEEMHDHCSI